MADITKIANIFSDKDVATTIISFFSFVLIIWMGLSLLYKWSLQSRKCSSIDEIMPNKSNTLGVSKDLMNTAINNFYIKTAYNCCSLGDYANDYVGTCILTAILKQGVRCIDFELFSINDKPVVATSTTKSYNEKETYNSIPFKQVLALISAQAFTGDISPNPKDPLFIHLRIKSGNIKMFSALNRMLNKLQNLYKGDVSPSTVISTIMGKIVIIVSQDNKAYLTSGAYNMISGTPPFYLYKYESIQNLSSAEIKEMQKPKTMSIVIPSAGSSPPNIDLNKIIKMQCNMVAMRYQLNDPQLTNYNAIFNDCAFILKTDISVD
jgi:hypothetical protein